MLSLKPSVTSFLLSTHTLLSTQFSNTQVYVILPLMWQTKFHIHKRMMGKFLVLNIFKFLYFFYTVDEKTKYIELNGLKHCPKLLCS
jgi:hypothetical protein